MFIRKTTNPKGVNYYHLVESYREKDRVRQRSLLPLGKKGGKSLDSLLSAVKRFANLLSIDEAIEELKPDKSYILGPLLLLDKLFERLGINEVLEGIKRKQKTQFDLKKIVFTLVLSRFVLPCSKLQVFERLQNMFYPEMLQPDIKLHQFYRVLDILADKKDHIEHNLYLHQRDDLFKRVVDVVLYDLTTLRFESVREDLGDLRKFGYSKERRGDMVQVVFALLVDKDGLPLGFEVYPGNTFEGHTLPDIVRKVKKKFQVSRFIMVADRGLFSNGNLKILKASGGEFILGMKLGVFRKRHEDFYDKSRLQKRNEDVSFWETEHEGERLIVTHSKKRADRDRKKREEVLEKIAAKLDKKTTKSRDFVSHTAYKKYVRFSNGKKPPVLNEDAIFEAEKKDGFFGLVTNVKDQSVPEILSHYKNLWRIEDGFRELKGNLKVRPVFHWTDKRITGHLVMCFLAYMCEAWIAKKLREKKILRSPALKNKNIKPRILTAKEALQDLNQITASFYTIKDKKVWVRSDIKTSSAQILRTAQVKLPRRILKMSH